MKNTSQNPVLSAENLTIGYLHRKQKNSVARNMNFSFREGELIGLVGANGIGKSTLLRTLAKMQPALAGQIFLNSKNINAYSSFELAVQVSVVLTEAPATKNLSALEMVSLGRQPHTNWIGKLTPTDQEAIFRAMKLTDTESISERKCFELSDGQMQRVAIARALAQDTPLMLLDEPTTHLDLYHRANILKLLKDLSRSTGKTILFSSHEIDLAIQLADKLLIMTEENTFFDSPENLIRNKKFDSLFPGDLIEFDPETRRFGIKK